MLNDEQRKAVLDQFLLEYRDPHLGSADDVDMTTDLVELLQKQDYFAFLKYLSECGGIQDIFDDQKSMRKIPEADNYYRLHYEKEKEDEK